MRIVILGAGGLGSVVGGYLANVGVEVTLIGRPAHVAAIRRGGLQITGLRGEFLIRENLTAVSSADEAIGNFDYLALAVKGKDTYTALEQAASLRARTSTVLSLQNGVGHDDDLLRWAGADKVLGASTIEGGTLLEPGKVANGMTTPTTAYFGEIDGRPSARAKDLTDAFNRAGLPSKCVNNIVQVQWEKLTQIATASGFSAVTLCGLDTLTMGDGLAVREGAEHFVQLSKELIAVYKAMGYTPQNFYAPVSRLKELDRMSFEEAIANVMELSRHLKGNANRARTSMHNDVLQHRKTEVDFIFGPVIAKAREVGVQIPTVMAVYRILKTLDAYFN
ncbi:MAG: 2-dehydropantoate 2-reductase [Candidatus Binataceae bacterium]|nr:2-dehydropantoate 2-reductase [Candidatus Binataceae bacterium]